MSARKNGGGELLLPGDMMAEQFDDLLKVNQVK